MPVILPDSKFRTRWDTGIMLLVAYYAFSVPLYLGFIQDDPPAVVVVDWLAWVIFLVDIALNFNTAYKEDGVLKTLRKDIARYYFRFWVWIDTLAILPMEYLVDDGDGASSQYKRLNKLVRLLRIFKLFRVFRAVRIMRRFEDFAKVNPAVLRLFKLLLVLLVFWHWSACLYWFVCWIEEFQVHQPYFSRDGSNRWVPPPELWCTDAASCPTQSSIDRFVECERVNATTIAAGGTSKVGLSQCPGIVGDQYTYAFFWAVMVTTGIGRDVEPVTSLEHIFSIIWIVLGVVMNAIIIGAASSALQNLDAGGAERREKLENITRYMRQRNVPKDLQKRIREYYEYMWSSHQSLNADGGVMNDLHHSLTLELNIILNRKLIENIPMFRVITNTNCLIDLIEKLIPKIYIPGEYIVLEGEAGDEMYIMLRGLVHVLVGKHSNNKQHVATLKEGEVFGERALITRETRNASIRAATYCDLLVLSKDDFDEVMRRYPEFFHSLQHLARLHANKGWGRVREAIKMTRAIRHFGGQVDLRSLLSASLEEAIVTKNKGGVGAGVSDGLTKHIEALKPESRRDVGRGVPFGEAPLEKVQEKRDSGQERATNIRRKSVAESERATNRRRKSIAESMGQDGFGMTPAESMRRASTSSIENIDTTRLDLEPLSPRSPRSGAEPPG